MEEPSIHGPIAEHRSCAGIRVWKIGLRPKLGTDSAEALRDFVVGVVPGDLFKDLTDILLLAHAAALRGDATHRMEHAVGRVNAVKVFRDFRAQKPPSYRMGRTATQFGRAAKIIDGDQNSARIRTVV